MKTKLTTTLLRSAALATALLAIPTFAFANDSSSADRATQALALKGAVPVKNAGPFVHVGSLRIQVSAKLGQPSAKLPDGTWLYGRRAIEGSAAEGTLVVRFSQGRVSELALVTPAIATAMLEPRKAGDRVLVANNQ